MLVKSAITVFLILSLFFSPVSAADKKVSFDGQVALGIIKALAADAMMGRKSGEPGGQMAADYVASKLKEWGIEPAGPKGSYFQDFPVEYNNVERPVSLEILAANTKRDFVYGEDWRQGRYSGSGNFVAGVIFIGYGISAPQKDYDDYAGVDVKGRLVLFSSDSPRKLEDKLKEEAKFENRIKAAQDHGALGVLTYRSEGQGMAMFSYRSGLKKEMYRPDFVILSVENKIVDFIFKKQKTDLRYLSQQVETTSKPQSFDTGVRAFLNLNNTYDEKRPVQNVLAKISGTDKNLKNEYVLLGAHMDHLGIDTWGDILNGADDNASGTAVVMEVARTMKLNQFKPKRTIVFALWAAEESGLFGSKYYTENPVYPLEKTVAYINLDMEGHGNGKVDFAGTYYGPEIWDVLKARLPKEMIENLVPSRGGPGGSDHTYFLSKGVPGFFVITDGTHFKTNRVGDIIELIQPEVLKKAGDFVEAAVGALATEPKIPIQAQRQENYYWKYETVVNYQTVPLEQVIEEHKDAKDPDVDFQLATINEKEGLSGDTLRIDVMKSLLAGLEKLKESKGLALHGAAGPSPMMMMRGRQAGNTTVLIGLRGVVSFRDDLRWADVFAKQGIGFVLIDEPAVLFGDKGLSEEGKKTLESLQKANLLLIASGFDSTQARVLLENFKKPVLLEMSGLPGKDILDLIKTSNSSLGLVFGKNEDGAAFFKKVDEAKKAVGTEFLSIVTENGLWGNEGKEQTIKVIGELLKAKYENEDIANLFSVTFLRVLSKARGEDGSRPFGFMMY